MHAQWSKEWRLLRPGLVAAIGLAVLPLVMPGDERSRFASNELFTLCMFFGGVLLGIETFGREFHQHTSTLWLALPRSRAGLWWSKLATTGLAVAGVTLVNWVLLFFVALFRGFLPNLEELMRPLVGMLGGAALGLFWSVWLRQTWAAFWMSLIVPGALMMALLFLRSLWYLREVGSSSPVPDMSAVFRYSFFLLSVLAFVLARCRFNQLEDLGPVGDDVQLRLPRFMGSLSLTKRRTGHRRRSLASSLWWKEIRLQQVNLALAAGLAVVMLLTEILRRIAMGMPERFGPRDLDYIDFMWLLWVLLPLTIGLASMAEERRLGVDSWQETLPVSRARRWWIKMGTAYGLALVVGVVVPVIGMKASYTEVGLITPYQLGLAWLLMTTAGLYVSSLARNLVHAISILIPFAIGLTVALTGGVWLTRVWGPQPPDWYPGIPHDTHFKVVMLALWFVVLGWLGWKNSAPGFGMSPALRLNVSSLATTWFVGVLLVVGMRHRAWEWLRSEPAPLPVLVSYPEVKPEVVARLTHAAVLTPDGSLWSYGSPNEPVGPSRLKRLGQGHRWLHVGANELRVVAVRADGTLWQWGQDLVPDPERSRGLMHSGDLRSSWAAPRQIGAASDWSTVAVSTHALALKRDGTLWGWGNNRHGQLGGTNDSYVAAPIQIGDAANWTCVVGNDAGGIAANRAGEIWMWGRYANRRLLWDTDSVWTDLMQVGECLLGRNQREEIWLLQAWSWLDASKLPLRWEGSAGRDLILDYGLAWAINGEGQLLHWSTDPTRAPRTARLPGADEFDPVGRRNDWLALDAEWSLARSVGLTADGGLWVWGINYGELKTYLSLPLSRQPRQVALLRADGN